MHVHTPTGTRDVWIDAQLCPLMPASGLTWVGVTSTHAGYEYRHPATPGFQIISATGAVDISWEGRWRRLGPDLLLLIPPRSPAALRTTGDATVLWFCTAPEFSRVILEQHECVHAPALAEQMRSLVTLACADVHAPGGVSSQAPWLALLASLGHRALALADEATPPDTLTALWQRVATRPGEAWDLARLTRVADCSRERLRRATQAAWGRSPMQHVTWIRLHHAALLLRRDQASIAAIAKAVGFANPFAFSTAFRRQFACTPRAYRAAAAD